MNDAEQTLAQLKAEASALNWKVNKWLHLIFGLRILGAAIILFSVFVWGGLPLNFAGMGLFLSTWLLPKGPDESPDIDRWRLVSRQAMEVEQLMVSMATEQIPASQVQDKLTSILSAKTESAST